LNSWRAIHDFFAVPASAQPLMVFALCVNLYSLSLIGVTLATDWGLLIDGKFSLRKFYTLMGWAPLGFLGLVVVYDIRFLWLFLAAGVLGVVGELIVSVAWRAFFAEPIWTYSFGARLRGYTSELNFLPWAVGAFLFYCTAGLLQQAAPRGLPVMSLREPLVLCVLGGLAGLIVWPLAFLRRAERGRFGVARFAVFCAPILGVGAALSVVLGVEYAGLMLAFSLVGFATEYLYGRIMSAFFEVGLWEYNHLKIDGGHSSFVTFPLWALGGLYFHFIAGWVGL
jgi:hypothetical protein